MTRPSPTRLAILATLTLVSWLGTRPGSALAEDNPKVWSVVVGINAYEDTLIPRCSGSIRDARSVTEWLTARWGVSSVLRMDDLGRKVHGPAAQQIPDLLPTRENLEWAVKEWLGERVRPGDVVVFYFAGQSTALPPASGASAGRAYLLPIDARASSVAQTGWSIEDALDRSGTARKANVVIWLDTSIRGRGVRGLDTEEKVPSGLDWLRSITRWKGVTAWLASEFRRAPEDGAFVNAIRNAMGQPGQAHNLLGALGALNGDQVLKDRGFRTMGGFEPALTLWPGKVAEPVVPELIVQAGHGDRVNSVIVTADNARVVSASMDSTVRVWKLGEREPAMVRVLTEPFVGVFSLALDRDNRLLVAGDGNGGIVGWDMTQDKSKPTYGRNVHEEAVVSLAFLPDSLSFVSVDKGGRSFVWDGSGGVIKNPRAFSADSISRLVAASRPEAGAPSIVAALKAAAAVSDSIEAFDARGAVAFRTDGPGGRITALDLSLDGRRMVVGNDRGRVKVVDLPGRSVAMDRRFSGEIYQAQLSSRGWLAISDDKTLRLVEPRAGGLEVELLDPRGVAIPGRVPRAAFSPDGQWLAACTENEGRVLLWRLGDPARPIPVAIADDEAPGLSLGFSPDGKVLILGDKYGGIRAWSLEDGPDGPRAQVLARIKPARGRVASLSPSPSGKLLLEITKDDLALIWNLEQGREVKMLKRTWSSGAFLPDESKLLLTRTASEGGGVVLLDRSSGEPVPIEYRMPQDAAGKTLKAAFVRLVVSRSGKLVAAAAADSQAPLACVWEVATGNLVHTATLHDDGLTALDFSGDEAYLLTASADGKARLWPLADRAVELRSPVIFSTKDPEDPAVTQAKVSPADPHRVATGTRGGQVQLWSWEKGKSQPARQGEPFRVNGSVNALTFSNDGKWLAVSGSMDKLIRFFDISAAGPPRRFDFSPRFHHAEQIGALTSSPDGSIIISGGDDAAVRFWDLKKRTLVGTYLAQVRNAQVVDWLAYTPEGLFDGSMKGEEMIKWRVGEKIVTLQQTQDTHYAFRLGASIARGEKPAKEEPPLKAEGPSLKLFAPPAGPGLSREVELRLWSDTPKPAQLRLYQNGVPVRGEGDFQPGETENFVTTRIQLRTGLNRFYAMATKPGAVDGKSEEVAIPYEGRETTGRLHTLALGISEYQSRALKYAHSDALGIADFLRKQGVRGAERPGERFVLTDGEVTEARIDDAFLRLRDAVKGRPEDTVVLFMAGHTDNDDVNNQFCLLLPQFPFHDDPPTLANVVTRGTGVSLRGNAGESRSRVRVGDKNVLPYSILYNRLTRLEALQRLVIVDACQAGAILDDRAVARIQENVERDSRKARNSYLLAARRGEPANEVDALQHGLLTYTLLRGMGAVDLQAVPEGLGGYPGPASADLDRDGVVSSDELVAYTDETLPKLARMFPQVVSRSAGPTAAPSEASTSPELERKLRLQSNEVSFPLVVVPR